MLPGETRDLSSHSHGKLLKVEFRGLFEISDSLLNPVALAHSAYFRALGDKEIVFSMDHRRKSLPSHCAASYRLGYTQPRNDWQSRERMTLDNASETCIMRAS